MAVLSDEGFASFTVEPVSPTIGAVVGGIDLRRPLERPVFAELHRALMRYLVLFFRDQDISPEQQVTFGRGLGELDVRERASFEAIPGFPELSSLLNDRERLPNIDHYHTDGIFYAVPEYASMLRSHEVPTVGGDTIFVSQYAAWDGLSPDLQHYLRGKVTLNDFMKLQRRPSKADNWKRNPEGMERSRKARPPVEHPLVKCHPVTQREHLYLSEGFTEHIVGLPKSESDAVLALLFDHCRKPEFQYRFSWKPNSIALWDNRATMHYAVADYWPEVRRMTRLTINTDAFECGGRR